MPACAIASSKRRRLASASMPPLLRRVFPPIAVIAARSLGRNIAGGDVALDLLAAALERIAPATAACRAEGEPVAGLELQAGRLAQPLLGAVAPDEDGLVDGAGFAAGKSPGRILGALVVHVGHAFLQRTIGQIDAEPAAMPAGAAGIRAQRELFDQERILNLLQFDRRAAHVALTDRNRRGFTVLVRPPAPAAAEDVHQQEAPPVRAEAADRTAAHIALVGGG